MSLIGAADLFIGVDTGFTHVAEGLNVKNIAIYSTVPWWTRAKHYKYQTTIDLGTHEPSYYTFCLNRGDPLNLLEGIESMTDREKKIVEFNEKKVSISEAAKFLNTTENGVEAEFLSVKNKIDSLSEKQSKSLSAVSVEMVMEKISEALC